MRLTSRDVNIIEFIQKNTGATIEQIQIMFFPSYNTTKRRLRLLKEGNYLKCSIHPILNKKVYYIKKLPSYHSLVINHVCILLRDKIYKVQREFKVGKYRVDALLILNNKDIIILEVDIFNKTSKNKFINIKNILNSKGLKFKMIIVTKTKDKRNFCEKILIDEIDKIKYIV